MIKFITKTVLFLAIPALIGNVIFISAPYIHQTPSEIEFRNPYFRRGWPEYIERSLSRNENNTKFVILSNSQGFGREIIEEETYSYYLQHAFNENGIGDIKVLNWSIPGAMFYDILIPTAKALSENVDYLCIIIYCSNFSTDISKRTISYSLHDIPYILKDNSVTSLLPYNFVKNSVDLEFQKAYFPFIISLLRAQDHLEDIILKYTEKKETYWWQYPIGGPSMRSTLGDENNIKKINISSYNADCFKHLDEVFQHKKQTKIFIILMPLAKIALTEKAITNLEKFNAYIKDHYKASDITVWDMTDSLDEELFYSHTHFSPNNHKKFANLIFNEFNLKVLKNNVD